MYEDSFSRSFRDSDSFLGFLEERKEKSSWTTAQSKSIHFVPVEKDSPLASLYMQIYEKDGRAEVMADTMEHTAMLLSVNGEEYPVRSCALKTILERARISGHALNKVSAVTFAQILNYCMEAPETTTSSRSRTKRSPLFTEAI